MLDAKPHITVQFERVFPSSRVKYAYKETEGGHTWPNWRAYLTEFAPQLFR